MAVGGVAIMSRVTELRAPKRRRTQVHGHA